VIRVAASYSVEMPPATAGELAVINLQSSLQRAWDVLGQWPDRLNTAERVVEEEKLNAQFLGDVTAFDRLTRLASELSRNNPESASTHLVAAQVSSLVHRFADAKTHLAEAHNRGASVDVTSRVLLSIKQALGEDLQGVLKARWRIAETSTELQELVPLGALLADLGEFEEADRIYLKAIEQYRDVSPFALAWVCFQLGVLWGETVPEPQSCRAAKWYQRALGYLPSYISARVHLSEIFLDDGDLEGAEALLAPVVASGDPEVNWRLSEVLEAQSKRVEADLQRNAARSGFESLLVRHELAFADHAAEFYLNSGADPQRACDLARANLANRSTRRAFELAHVAALRAGDQRLARELLARAGTQPGSPNGFAHSPFSTQSTSRSNPAITGTDI
jgi:tetratricopeptide (TPR) repeat protein